MLILYGKPENSSMQNCGGNKQMLTIHYENYHYPKNENGGISIMNRKLVSVDEYMIEKCPSVGVLVIQKNGIKKNIRVEDCSEFVFKALKTKIKARDGVTGLYRFIEENQEIGDVFGCMVKSLLNEAFSNMKEATIR